MTLTIVHILGPGGAGKSTVGALLGTILELPVVDLDAYFIEHIGDISQFIGNHGYREYALRNVHHYRMIVEQLSKPTIMVLSSGFMAYPSDLDAGYSELVLKVEEDALSVLMLPSFDAEECVSIIVDRQLKRAYLNADREKEEARIRRRFPIFMELRCKRFLSNVNPNELAMQIGEFIKANLSLNPDRQQKLPLHRGVACLLEQR